MDGITTTIIVTLLVGLVALGVHVAVALGVTSIVGLTMVTGSLPLSLNFLSSTAYEALRDYIFVVVPLFILMGEFLARSGAAGDVYIVIQRGLRRLPGRLAYATVLGNAVFAFVTGTSVAAATAFTKIAYPEMRRHGYHPAFSLGLIAGSACLGPLIPPSVLFIVWGILTEQSIGVLFLAGVMPGLLLAAMLCGYIFLVSLLRPDLVGAAHRGAASPAIQDAPLAVLSVWTSCVGVLVIIVLSIGGIWFGWFTPTEAAGVGALLALALAVIKGQSIQQIWEAVLGTGRTSIPIMILLFAAQLYSRTLALSGVGQAIQDFFLDSGLGPNGILFVMIVIWFLMGMLIDSISIMLLTVPVFAPLAQTLGFDPVAFALIGVLVIEAGLLTPPFGINVFAVKAAVGDDGVPIRDIFWTSTPTWVLLLLIVAMMAIWPSTATLLPRLLS